MLTNTRTLRWASFALAATLSVCTAATPTDSTFKTENGVVVISSVDVKVRIASKDPNGTVAETFSLREVFDSISALQALVQKQETDFAKAIANINHRLDTQDKALNKTDGLSVANNKKIVADEKAITANKGIIQQNGKAIDANKKAVALNTNQVKLNKDRLAQKVTAIVKMTSAANCHARNYVELVLDGKKQSGKGGRGIHIARIETDPVLKMVDYKTFDTHGSKPAAAAMAKYLNALPDGTIIACGMYDEGQNSLIESAFAALERFGSRYIRGIEHRESWAMIGIAGAPVGSVAESDGGGSTGGAPKSGCGGMGKIAVVTQQLYTGMLSSSNLGSAQALQRFNSGSLINAIDHHRIVHSGKVYGGGDWPHCKDKPGYLKIAHVKNGYDGRYIRIFVYGSHRGYNRGGYYENEEFVIQCGDKCSSHTIQRRGQHKVRLYNPQTGRTGDYSGNGNFDIGSGKDILLRFEPQCGANLRYTYRVEIWSDQPDAINDKNLKMYRQTCVNFQRNKDTKWPFAKNVKYDTTKNC